MFSSSKWNIFLLLYFWIARTFKNWFLFIKFWNSKLVCCIRKAIIQIPCCFGFKMIIFYRFRFSFRNRFSFSFNTVLSESLSCYFLSFFTFSKFSYYPYDFSDPNSGYTFFSLFQDRHAVVTLVHIKLKGFFYFLFSKVVTQLWPSHNFFC